MRKFRAIVETHKEPLDRNVLWYYKGKLLYWSEDAWKLFHVVRGTDICYYNNGVPSVDTVKSALDELFEAYKQLEESQGDNETVPEVLPFDGIETLEGIEVLRQKYSPSGSVPDKPGYNQEIFLVYDTVTNSFLLKVPVLYDCDVPVSWEYYSGWDVDVYAYRTPLDYSNAIAFPNRAIFLNRIDGKSYRYEDGLIAVAGSSTGENPDITNAIDQLIATDTTLSDRITELEESSDNTLSDRISALEQSLYPLSLSLNVSPSILEYTGNNNNVFVTRYLYRKGQAVDTDDIEEIYTKYGDKVINNLNFPNPQSTTQIVNSYGLHLFSAGAKAFGSTVTATCSMRMELPMYFGFSSLDKVAPGLFGDLEKQALAASPTGEHKLTNKNEGYHLWLCVPERMSINSVTSSGFQVPMLDGFQYLSTALGRYKCYRSASESGINEVTMQITIL